jgi:hypothetical protein
VTASGGAHFTVRSIPVFAPWLSGGLGQIFDVNAGGCRVTGIPLATASPPWKEKKK